MSTEIPVVKFMFVGVRNNKTQQNQSLKDK